MYDEIDLMIEKEERLIARLEKLIKEGLAIVSEAMGEGGDKSRVSNVLGALQQLSDCMERHIDFVKYYRVGRYVIGNKGRPFAVNSYMFFDNAVIKLAGSSDIKRIAPEHQQFFEDISCLRLDCHQDGI